jgi:hypothetical protein
MIPGTLTQMGMRVVNPRLAMCVSSSAALSCVSGRLLAWSVCGSVVGYRTPWGVSAALGNPLTAF